MPTITADKVQTGLGIASANFNLSRTANAASVDTNPSGNDVNVVQYFRSLSRGGLTIRFKRVFVYFDTSGVTGTVASADIRVTGGSAGVAANGDTLFAISTAFGGDGSSNLTTAEFNDIDYTKSRTAVINAGDYNENGTNDYAVNSDGLAQIKNIDYLILALIEEDADLNNTEGSDDARGINIDFDTDFQLIFTLATGYTHDVSGLAAASIGKINTVATANIGKINSLD